MNVKTQIFEYTTGVFHVWTVCKESFRIFPAPAVMHCLENERKKTINISFNYLMEKLKDYNKM